MVHKDDKSGDVRGPYSTRRMKRWYKKKQLTDETFLSRERKGTFVRICDMSVSPFTSAAEARGNSNETEVAVSDEWYMKDELGEVHGPFSTRRMRSWHKRGRLNEDAQIAQKQSGPFLSLSAMERIPFIY